MKNDRSLPPPAAPVIKVVLPNNLYGQYPAPAGPLPLILGPQMTGLIPATHEPGSKLDMATFCAVFNLSNAIYQHLKDNTYTGTQAFAHMESAELIELGFKREEIVDLKEAVKEWAVRKA